MSLSEMSSEPFKVSNIVLVQNTFSFVIIWNVVIPSQGTNIKCDSQYSISKTLIFSKNPSVKEMKGDLMDCTCMPVC